MITARDIATALGLERQRALLGCAEDASACMSELGAALGCDAIITANLARLDDSYEGSLRVLSARDGKTIADERVEATGQKALARVLEGAAHRLARKLRPPPPPASVRHYSWIPLAAAVALGVGAGVSLAVANTNLTRITSSDEPTAIQLARDGKTLQGAGWAMAGVGAGALVGAALLYFLGGGPGSVAPQVHVTGAGASIGLTGVVP